ncbi:MAG: hypothetical protein JWM42_615 [Burkholderia sp.]|nr:hypothetical protein [Burkholderia sp.]
MPKPDLTLPADWLASLKHRIAAFPTMKGFSRSNLKDPDQRRWYLQQAIALRGMTQPIGVAEYHQELPKDLAGYLPTIEQIETELQKDDPADGTSGASE